MSTNANEPKIRLSPIFLHKSTSMRRARSYTLRLKQNWTSVLQPRNHNKYILSILISKKAQCMRRKVICRTSPRRVVTAHHRSAAQTHILDVDVKQYNTQLTHTKHISHYLAHLLLVVRNASAFLVTKNRDPSVLVCE